MISVKVETSEPLFIKDGYALYQHENSILMPDGRTLLSKGRWNEIIGVKPDAPQWAKDEYEQWIRTTEQAKKEGIKL